MSADTRSALGDVENLAGSLAALPPVGAHVPSDRSLSFSKIYEAEGRCLFVLETADQRVAGRRAASGLIQLADRFVGRYFRLEGAARSLSSRVNRRKGGRGRTTIRQVERERRRLGRELHTGVGQMLAAIRLQSEIIAGQQSSLPSPVQEALNRISTLATEALDQVRSVSRHLYPPEWQRLTLEAALRELWQMSGVPERFEAKLRIEALPREPDPEVKALIYRAAQEGLSNLALHSRAAHAALSLTSRQGQVLLEVVDDGVGFDAEARFSAPASVASGIGLRSIREHAAELGGKMEMESSAKGTTLIVSAPFSVE